MMDLARLNEMAVSTAKRLKVDDAVALTASGTEKMIRFANNSLTVVKEIDETELSVYLAKDRKRIVASTSNPLEANVKSFVGKLFESLKGLTPQPDYAPLPTRSHRYPPRNGSYDKKLDTVESALPELANEAIESSLKGGGVRSAGAVVASVSEYRILTSAGTEGQDKRGDVTLNIRSFTEGDASGHGLSCSANLGGFDPASAGRKAGENAKKMVGAKEPAAGEYQVLMSPTVASNLINLIGGFASAFSVDAGISYLVNKLGHRVASGNFSLTDHGTIRGGLDGRSFDDEGTPTQSTAIIEKGILKSYLHNLTTAKKSKTKSTGSAGLLDPRTWNLEVGAGDSSYEEMVKSVKRGVILTSNWYTRFKNYRTGEFSTVPRDGSYLVENGNVVRPLKGLRVSDTLERMFSSVQRVSKDREWIQWWEVDTPTLSPWLLVDGVKITRAYE
jgi:PmbA protein